MINLSNSYQFQLEVLSLMLKDSIFAGRFLNIFTNDTDLKSINYKIFSNDLINQVIALSSHVYAEGHGISHGVLMNRILRDPGITTDDKEGMEKIISQAFAMTIGSSHKYEKDLIDDIKIAKTTVFFKRVGKSMMSNNPKEVLDYQAKAAVFNQELSKISISTDSEVLLGDFLAIIKEYNSDMFSNIPLGIREIDEILNGGGKFGGLGRGEVTIFLSGVNDGKSLSMISFEANAIALGFKGIHINLEGKRLQPPMRLISNLTKISYKRLTQKYKEIVTKDGVDINDYFTPDEFKRIKDAQEKAANLRVFHEISNCDIGHIEGVIREANHQSKIDFVVIDYAMLITSTTAHGKREEMLSDVFRRLEILAAALQIVIVTPMQVNRSGLSELRNDAKGGNKYPIYTMDNVSDVKRSMDTAATVISYSRTQEERIQCKGRYCVIKQREGRLMLQVGIESNFDCNSMFDGIRYYIGDGLDEVKTKGPASYEKFEALIGKNIEDPTNVVNYIDKLSDFLDEIKKLESNKTRADMGTMPEGLEMTMNEYLDEIKMLSIKAHDDLTKELDNKGMRDSALKFMIDSPLTKYKNAKTEAEKRLKEISERACRLNVIDYLGESDGYN